MGRRLPFRPGTFYVRMKSGDILGERAWRIAKGEGGVVYHHHAQHVRISWLDPHAGHTSISAHTDTLKNVRLNQVFVK